MTHVEQGPSNKSQSNGHVDARNTPLSHQSPIAQEDAADIEVGVGATPKGQRKGDLSNASRRNTVEADSQTDAFDVQDTPSRRKRKRYKASPVSQGQNDRETMDKAQGTACSSVDVQQPLPGIKKGNGRSSEAPNQPEDNAVTENGPDSRQSEHQQTLPDTGDASNRVEGRPRGKRPDRLYNELSEGRTRRKSRRNQPIEIKKATKTGPPPTTTPRSGRKRGRPRKFVPTAGASQDEAKDELSLEQGLAKNATPHASMTSPQVSEGSVGDELGSGFLAPAVLSTPVKERRDTTKAMKHVESLLNADTSIPTADPILDEEAPQSFKSAAAGLQRLLLKDDTSSLMTLKSELLDGLTGKRRLPLVNLDQEYKKVHQLVEQTVLAGEGNSALIIGSRGTAKTTLVETVISNLSHDHRDVFHVVRLNGFIHTDDKLALREIWRQLGREMEVEDDSMGARNNYADTLTSLLALLAHSAEGSGEAPHQTAKSVVFVLDEFDLFVSHPRQTLLYNLFDVAQSRNAPIIVLGLTTRVDVVESMEKRVKSRFGQRYIHLSLPRTLASFRAICKSALIPQSNISCRLSHSNSQPLFAAWTAYVHALFAHDPALQSVLETLFSLSKSISAFLTAAYLSISTLSPTHLPSFPPHPLLHPPDSKLHLLPSLPDADLALLIAAARLDIILDADNTCTFGMAYDEYATLAGKFKAASSAAGQTAVGGAARVWSREVAREAWERLIALELLLPATGGAAGKGGAGMWRVDVALEEIAPSVPGLGGAMAKWCLEI